MIVEVSVITGQINPKSELSIEEIDELKEVSDIIIENISVESPNTWKPGNNKNISKRNN